MFNIRHPFVLGVLVLFAVLWAALLPFRLSEPLDGDAISYEAAAHNLVTMGFYSQDGVVPFVEREPGMSVFVAALYAIFGTGRFWIVFLAQALLHIVAVYLFARETQRIAGDRAAMIAFAFLMLFPPVFHGIFSFNRESLALSLLMLMTVTALRWFDTKRATYAALTGMLLGYLILTHVAFLPFPVFILPLLAWYRAGWGKTLLMLLLCAAVVSPWALRNMEVRGRMCLTGCTRSAVTWHVRGVQSEHVHGIEPLMCLWAEYVSRDWTNRSPACSFNKLMHDQWPEGFPGRDEDLITGKEGQRKILKNLPSYLWFSVFEVLELHLPYVNGWGRFYNILTVIATLIIYAGMLLGVRSFFRHGSHLFFVAIMLYVTALFALTDATPRYLMPIIFCYVFFASLGYDRALSRIKWPR